jgi:thioredoxin 1
MQEVTRETYDAAVIAASKDQPVLVDFWGPRCVPCLQLMPWVEELAERTAGALKVVKVNSAASLENRRLCVEHNVMGLPTFIIYRDGAEVRRLTGDGCTPPTIAEALREVVPALPQV